MDEREKRLGERFQEHWSHIPICGEQARLEEYHKWLKAECLRLMAQQEWVKVSERLPENDGRYLVARSNNFPRVDIEWFATSDHAFFDDGEEDTNVIYWRGLPTEGGKE